MEIQNGNDITAKSFLFRILNTALDAYNQTSFEDKDVMSVNISKDAKSFYFDVQEESVENFKALFTEDGMIKYGIGRRSGCRMEEITTTEQLD